MRNFILIIVVLVVVVGGAFAAVVVMNGDDMGDELASTPVITDSSGISEGEMVEVDDGDKVGDVSSADEINVQYAPDFTLDALGGGQITLSDYRGEKPVVLDFWASWCPNCQRDMPVMAQLYEKYGDQVEMIGINLQESERTAQSFVDQKGINFPIVLDSTGDVSSEFGVFYTNVHVLINKAGEVVEVLPGDISEQDVVDLIGA